ncbi:MAG: hypothetical protein Q4G68_09015 [Planctomycetia bacterium]|nr:hypothetical protein [Planctomycetia bacterium]
MKTNLQQLDIDSLVHAVMADLSRPPYASGQEPEPVGVTSHVPDKARQEDHASSQAGRSSAAAELRLSERLISLSLISEYDRNPSGAEGTIHRWRVPRKAVITPAARDELRKRGIVLLYDEGNGQDSTIAESDCFSLLVVNHLTEQKVPPVLAKLFQSYHAELVNQTCLVKTTQLISERISAPGRLAIVLTAYPGLAALLANRHQGLRALVAESADVLKKESELVAPNLLLINPEQARLWQSQEMIRWFLDRAPRRPASFLESAR